LDGYTGLLAKRGDFDANGSTDITDFASLFGNFGPATWTFDLNVDGVVDALDAEAFVTELVRSVPGDFNVDGQVDAADYSVWRDKAGQGGGALVADGNFDGVVDLADFAVWKAAFGFVRQALAPGGGGAATAAVPEPTVWALVLMAGGIVAMRRSVRRPRFSFVQ
jgi:alpha-amylase